MLTLTRLPKKIAYFLRGTQQFFRYRHHLVFSWTLILMAVNSDKTTLCGLARLGPKHLCEWHMRRFLCASYWCWRSLLWWFADAVISVLEPPEDGIIYFIGDGTFKEKTAKKHPLAKKGRLNSYSGYVFGLQLLIVMVGWKRYRIPIDFEIIRPKEHPDHQSMNALFRQMVRRFVPPVWTTQVTVVADAAFPAQFRQGNDLRQISLQQAFFLMREGLHSLLQRVLSGLHFLGNQAPVCARFRAWVINSGCTRIWHRGSE